VKPIPFVDVREGGPIAYAHIRAAAAVRLRDACLPIPNWTHGCLAPIDKIAANWLRRSGSPYRHELERVVDILGFPGAMTLNMSYLFACTTMGRADAAGAPMLRRSLDWPFRGLGECVEIAWQAGPAGDYYNVTWPGSVGVLSAMAPGRFSAVINQAPMQRRTRALLGFPYDLVANLRATLARDGDWPPDHLLRYAFETCADFEAAIELLSRGPLSRPALFTLSGARPGEIALIERTEREARVMRGPVIVANDWQEIHPGWQARMSHENNESRKAAMRASDQEGPTFHWAAAPVLNKLTRLVVELSAAGEGELAARGYECRLLGGQPHRATQDFHLREKPAA
jgi:hypothetical protein